MSVLTESVSTEKLLASGTIYKDSGKGNSKKKVATLLFHSIRWCGIYRKLLFVDNALKMENKLSNIELEYKLCDNWICPSE